MSEPVRLTDPNGSRGPSWIPFIGWVDLDQDAARELGLDGQLMWSVFVFEWFDRGFTLFAKSRNAE